MLKVECGSGCHPLCRSLGSPTSESRLPGGRARMARPPNRPRRGRALPARLRAEQLQPPRSQPTVRGRKGSPHPGVAGEVLAGHLPTPPSLLQCGGGGRTASPTRQRAPAGTRVGGQRWLLTLGSPRSRCKVSQTHHRAQRHIHQTAMAATCAKAHPSTPPSP